MATNLFKHSLKSYPTQCLKRPMSSSAIKSKKTPLPVLEYVYAKKYSTFTIDKWTDNLSKPVAVDMIGTPDPISNLRPVKYYISPNETKEEKEWRESCEKVDAFNENFWHNNNTMFVKAKAEYEDQLRANGEEVTAEAMSVFYKDFLNKAYDRQMEYNRTWWKMNIAQLYPGFKAAIRSFKGKNNTPDPQLNKGQGFWEKSFES